MNASMTPYAAGIGRFVDLTKERFIGRDAWPTADPRPRLFGLRGQRPRSPRHRCYPKATSSGASPPAHGRRSWSPGSATW